ncbi:hypothetical protein [Porphyrobacter sp. AAP60]|uniref:hypothetical protein n=1 Tax=Porphyrobacter sp. AAP60 TaxID=1523423 RepID=UPI0006B8A958|nr:hypothetical protein [Porphyrobacter sp. AAP60]KPF65254.1 hypothetical protein IP79_03565 [Porphyrobacter sp. AAP60]
MRIGLIAAVTRTAAGDLRAELPLAGRSVLGWQVDLLRMLGAERILCLAESATGEVLRLQHDVERAGGTFHALQGFAAIPALVRSEDELIVLRDGLVPDPAVMAALAQSETGGHRMVATIPDDHPLAAARPQDFERIDATRHWAGLLIMRGAPVQQLADFPADSDPVSVLVRLALQAGTPCRELSAQEVAPETWLLADCAGAVMAHERLMLAKVAPQSDWRAPLVSLAGVLVRALMPRGLAQGAVISGASAIMLILTGLLMAVFGWAIPAIALASAGAFAAAVAAAFDDISGKLRTGGDQPDSTNALPVAVDLAAAATLWFALSPWPVWNALAVCGPVVIGLARLAGRDRGSTWAVSASDRAALLLVLALAAAVGLFPEVLACLALGLLAGLLLRAGRD